MTTQHRNRDADRSQGPEYHDHELQSRMQAKLREIVRRRRTRDLAARSGAGSGAMQRRRVASALARRGADVSNELGASSPRAWRLGLSLALALFAAVPAFDGGIACGAGLVALFAGLLVLQVVAAPQRP